jgi:hypothetical protein
LEFPNCLATIIINYTPDISNAANDANDDGGSGVVTATEIEKERRRRSITVHRCLIILATVTRDVRLHVHHDVGERSREERCGAVGQ